MLRVAFFGQSSSYSLAAWKHVFSKQDMYQIVAVVEGRTTPVYGLKHRLRQGRVKTSPKDDTQLAGVVASCGIDVLQTCDVNDALVIRFIKHAQIDRVVCVGFHTLFSQELLQVSRLGGLNAHPSKLPLYRGPSPIFWQLREGVHASSVTIHALDAHEDHGEIYAQSAWTIPKRATGEEIYKQAGDLAGRMLAPLLTRFGRSEEVRTHTQFHAQATRARRPKPEDALIVPRDWTVAHVIDFATGAPFFRTPWFRFGEAVFFARTGLESRVGEKLPGDYVVLDDLLYVQCLDGVAVVLIQTEPRES